MDTFKFYKYISKQQRAQATKCGKLWLQVQRHVQSAAIFQVVFC